MAIDTIILAGAPAGPEMSPEQPSISRAMLHIGEKTMLQWVVDALKGSKSVGRMIAIGDVAADGIDQVLTPSDSFLGNLMLGVDACGDCERILVATSDIPMLTPEAVDDFLGRALHSGGDMCYPIIPIEACNAKYPGMKRTSLKTGEGSFTGGNMMVLSTEFIRQNRDTILRAYEARKKPLALLSMVGFDLLPRFPISQWICPRVLPLSLLEARVSRMLGGKVVGIRTEYAEIGSDVDKPGDLRLARELLA